MKLHQLTVLYDLLFNSWFRSSKFALHARDELVDAVVIVLGVNVAARSVFHDESSLRHRWQSCFGVTCARRLNMPVGLMFASGSFIDVPPTGVVTLGRQHAGATSVALAQVSRCMSNFALRSHNTTVALERPTTTDRLAK